MAQSARIFLLTLLSALISAGMMGCAVFSGASAGTPQSPNTAASAHHGEVSAHAHHGRAGASHADPGSGDKTCDSCEQRVLNRLAKDPAKITAGYEIPAPVFILPAALSLAEAPRVEGQHADPPGRPPPSGPRTLTHQKISLLI